MEIRLATRADISNLVILQNVQYARKQTPEYFEWQFFSSYYPTICVAAWDNSRLVGMFGVQKRILTDGIICGHLIDLLIDAKYRGQGIFSRLCDYATTCFPDLQALTVLANLSGKNACVKSLGMTNITKLDDLIVTPNSIQQSKPCQGTPPKIRTAFKTDEKFC